MRRAFHGLFMFGWRDRRCFPLHLGGAKDTFFEKEKGRPRAPLKNITTYRSVKK